MSKVIRLLLALTLVLFACAKEKSAEPSATTVATTETTETTATTVPTASSSSTIAECDAYFAAVDKFMKCKNVPQGLVLAQTVAQQQMRANLANLQTLPEPARTTAVQSAKEGCSAALDSLRGSAKLSNCPIE